MNKKIHILMIDDDPAFLRLYGGQLSQLGFEMLYAHDGNEGREIARRLQPDLILLDVDMPIMNGVETASRLKSEDPTRSIPVIFLTNGDLSIEAEQVAQELGGNAYIHKSAPLEEVKVLIEKILATV